jgi:hypothetical protein
VSSDKQQKLLSYSRKEYAEVVEFPVEIVGRDGLVRQYCFEDAIRLYQRRVTFAPIRYRDEELKSAEIVHCRMRINQIRKSYFFRFGWGAPHGCESGDDQFGYLAGELTAFFQRVLQVNARPDVQVERIPDEEVWYVTPKGNQVGMLLYVHEFHGGTDDKEREKFFGALKRLERDGADEGSLERLVAFHHTNDCGLILTARGQQFAELAATQGHEFESREEPTQWEALLDMVSRGQYEQGLILCHAMVRAQPWDKKAYQMGTLLSSFLGYELTAEEMGCLGVMYFPEQAELHYWIGMARRRQGKQQLAVQSFREALRCAPELNAARYYLTVSLVEMGHFRAAAGVVAAATSGIDDRRGQMLLVRLQQWLRWRSWMVWGGAVGQIFGILVALFSGVIGLLPISMGIVITWAGYRTFRIQVEQLQQLQRFDDIGYWLRRIQRERVSNTEAS